MRTTIARQKGMLMLEVLISLLIFSLGVVGMVMMQSISSANAVNSEDRSTAAILANDLIAELWAAKSAAAPADYAAWRARVSAQLNAGIGTLTTAGNQATIVIGWTSKARNYNTAETGDAITQYATQVVIQ